MQAHAKHLCLLAFAAIFATAGAWTACAAEAPPPKIDKPKLESYLRYIEGYTPSVQLAIDDPVPSAYNGLFRVIVHISVGARKVGDRMYYVTPSGDRFVSGTVWQLGETPFLDTLEQLPTTGPSFGPSNAKVTIVVFSDFQCPYCREFAKTIRDNIPKKYPNDVRVVFEDFPLESVHPWALAAAEAGRCVGEQNATAFWAFHDWIFGHQEEVDTWFKQPDGAKKLKDATLPIAKAENEDAAKVASCIDSHAPAKEIEESVKRGRELQIQQTPTLFINGRMLPGALPWTSLQPVIELELNRPKDVPGPASAKCCEVEIPTVLKK